jgi:hypothetical protein
MTILWEFDESTLDKLALLGRSLTIAFAESPQIGPWVAKAFNRIYPLLL